MHFVENIAVDLSAADAVIHIDAHRTAASSGMGVMNVVVANTVASEAIVTTRVDRTDVTGFHRDVVDFIEFNGVVIAAQENCTVGMIVNQVVRHPLANTLHVNRWHIAFRPSSLTLEVAVLDKMSARCECHTIAADDFHASISSIEDVTTDHPVVRTAGDLHGVVANVANKTSSQSIAIAVFHFNGVAARGFES